MKIPTWFRPTVKSFRPDFQEIVDESKTYLLAQTLAPMKDLGRTLIFGLSGSIIAALGCKNIPAR